VSTVEPLELTTPASPDCEALEITKAALTAVVG
jgi:hypothetical protein